MDATALCKSLFEENWSESDLVSTARAYLQKSRSMLLDRHRAGAGGREIVSSYTGMVDYLIRRLFENASRNYIRRYPSLDMRCTLVAQGGYGRAELNPHSDIDLLFVYAWKVTPYVESVAETILYTLWDAGLQIGHATRSVPESIRLAGKDMKVKTSMLDARYLCGDESLYSDFAKAVEEQLIKKNAERFVREKLEESRVRHERYGGSVYLLEPDIKEGEGGLRDIHTALWVARVKQGLRDVHALADQGWIQERDLTDLKTSQDFLFRVRNELHFSAGKHQDQLTFEEQEKVGRAFDFKGEGTLKGVEVFMRTYYLHASQVSRLTSLIIHRVTGRSRGLNGKEQVSGREVRPGVRVSRGRLWISNPELIRSQPGALISVFADVQKYRAEISQEARELIRDHLDLIDEKFRRSAAGNLPFFKILKWRGRVYEALSEMHRCGVLGAFIPEFGRLLCMVLHDLYHIYTVDQHSLRLIREMERLKSGEFREGLPLLTQLAREVGTIEILYLGLLFHDIGKGHGGGHSEIGRRMVRGIARRMRLNVDDTAQLEFLVRHHLLMSHTAFRRDLEDEKTIIDFARTTEGVGNLKMLYLLTYADIRAVGPDVWNNWKASLLEELYLKTLGVLESLEKGEYQREDRRSKIRRIQGRLRRRLSGKYGPETVRLFLDAMPERYFLTTPEGEVPAHVELIRKFSDQTYLSSVRHFPEKEYSEIALCAKDRPGLFSRITGVFASMGMDVLNARITTRKDGLILDVFRVSHAGRADLAMDSHKWARLRTTMEEVLNGSVDVARLVEQSRRPSLFMKRAPKVPTVIQMDNGASDDFTVVEVYTQDRIGVLFAITYAMHRCGISIHLAKISTNVDQVADVFYVTDERGRKIEDKKRLEQVRRILIQELNSENEREAQSPH